MKYKAKDFTLDEKLKFLNGSTWGNLYNAEGKVKAVEVTDGPCGLRKRGANGLDIPATSMPTVSTLANGWSKESAYLEGELIAEECIENNIDVLLAPGVNIKRTPVNGRNFEYFSEDPFLAGTLAKEYIEGVQSKGIGTSLKHYCVNNRELDKTHQSSDLDERTLREIYLRPFEIALQAKPWTVMCSYNPINGVYASENKWLLKDILRDEFGFDGLIMSDWHAVHNPYKALKATLDLAMPYNKTFYGILTDAYNKGLITQEEIDYCVQNVLDLIEKTENDKKKVSHTKAERHECARKIAEEGIVLLKNEGVLPIKKGNYLVVGDMAVKPITGGGGSSLVVTDYEQKHLADLLSEVCTGATFDKTLTRIEPVFQDNVTDMYQKAESADGVIICVRGEFEGEAFDRLNIKLSKHIEDIIIRTAEINENVIVLVYAGSAVDMSAWIDKVKGVVLCGYSGEGVNEAVANIISGKVCPSGKLAETYPISIEDVNTEPEHGDGFSEWYKEGLFVGYRYYDTYNKQVMFPFGYGLSYADFTYSNLKVKKTGDAEFTVSYDITNNSKIDAKEISQIYVRDNFSMVVRPKKELKGFSKDLIKAGETKTVKVKLDDRAFAYYSLPLKKWHIENGSFDIMVGASVNDIRLSERVEINLPDQTQQSKS